MTASLPYAISADKLVTNVQETPSGIRFRISDEFLFHYITQTNQIIAEDKLLSNLNNGGTQEEGIFNLSEIEYGAPLEECLEMSNGNMENLTLELTRQCNCRCAYCLYSGAYDNRRRHAEEFMSWNTICSALHFYKSHNRKCRRAHISFYGGEALLAFQKIKNTVEYATNLFARSKPLTFTISTNGLLLADKVVAWLEENPRVSVVITLNGPFHDVHRVTTQGKATLDSILNNLATIKAEHPAVWNQQVNFICNIASLTEVRPLRDFYMNVIGKYPILVTGIHTAHANDQLDKIVKMDQKSSCRLWYNLAREYMSTGDDFLHVLFRSRIRHIYNRPIIKKGMPAIAKNCIPFLSNCFVSSDGAINLCEKIGEMSLGNVVDGIDKQKVKTLMTNAKTAFNQKCRRCWAQRLCSICFADMDNLLCKTAEIQSERCRVERENLAVDLVIFVEFALLHPKMFDSLYLRSECPECCHSSNEQR